MEPCPLAAPQAQRATAEPGGWLGAQGLWPRVLVGPADSCCSQGRGGLFICFYFLFLLILT